jgi:hypothetical protein
MVSSRPKERMRPVLNFFGCSNDFITPKGYFPQLMRVCDGLLMLLSQDFLAFNWSAGFGKFLQVSVLTNTNTKTALTTLNAIQAASQSTFITAQLYSACDREKYTSCVIKSLEHLKNFKNGSVLYLGQNLTIPYMISKTKSISCDSPRAEDGTSRKRYTVFARQYLYSTELVEIQ